MGGQARLSKRLLNFIKMNFADRLNAAIEAKNSVVCVGLDPRLERIPAFIVEKMTAKYGPTLEAAAEAFIEFNKGIIDAVADVAVIVKPQLAFYEALGHHGVRAFEETCAYAREKDLLVLADAKRSDIGSTAAAYAQAFLGERDLFGQASPVWNVDALTVNAYLGLDGVKPFLEACHAHGKGLFILVKTSNPSSGDLQDRLLTEGMSVADLMAHFVESWGEDLVSESEYSSIGAVVGATYPREAARLRELMPKAIFLVPGYGAQGGGAEDVKPCFNHDGLGAIVNSSRGILFAYEKSATPKGENYAEAARDEAVKMRDAINTVRS